MSDESTPTAATAAVPTHEDEDDPITPREYLVDDLFPVGEISLIAGPSGGGKTTLAMQVLRDFLAGKTIFGKQSHPAPIVYISCDRSKHSIYSSMTRVGLSPRAFPTLSVRDSKVSHSLDSVLSWIDRKHPQARLVFIEAIGALVPDGKINDYALVAKYLTQIGSWASKRRIALWGSTHATKTKEGEKFLNPRQRILGTVAWAGFSETVFTIEPTNPSNVDDPSRLLIVEPRDAAPFSINMTFDSQGRLMPLDDASELTTNEILDQELAKLPFDQPIRTADIVALGTQIGVVRRTVERWIDSAIERNLLERKRQGMFTRVV